MNEMVRADLVSTAFWIGVFAGVIIGALAVEFADWLEKRMSRRYDAERAKPK